MCFERPSLCPRSIAICLSAYQNVGPAVVAGPVYWVAMHTWDCIKTVMTVWLIQSNIVFYCFSIHGLDGNVALKTDGQKFCHSCGKGFLRLYNLKRHLVDVHGQGGTHECTICSKRFLNLKEYQEHINNHNKIPQNQCQCGKVFKFRQGLYKHKKTCGTTSEDPNPKPEERR